MNQLSLIETRKEDDKYVREVIKSLIDEKYSENRLISLLTKANQYEKNNGGSRGNRIVIKAAETRLQDIKQQITYGTNI